MKRTKQTEPHWQPLVELYFEFCKKKFGAPPSLDGSALMALKYLLKELKKRSEENKFEWTEDCAKLTFETFLEVAITDPWIANNFFLRILNSQKDKIFFKLASNENNKTFTTGSNGNGGTSSARISALKQWGTTRQSNVG